VGVLWGTKADYATFFGAEVEYIHGIQWLPFTPVTELLLAPCAWAAADYAQAAMALSRPSPPIQEGWRGLLIMMRAVAGDQRAAWADAASLTAYDDGNTKSNTLWWIATRAADACA